MANLESQKIIFMHLPKTGGTSLHTLLSANFEPRETCPERFNRLSNWDQSDLNSFLFFSGHFDWENVECIQGQKKIVTMLRNPADRIISLYYYWRAHSHKAIVKDGLNGPKMAKNLDLLEFLKCHDAGIPSAINNVLTRTLMGSVTRDAMRFNSMKKSHVDIDTALERASGLAAIGFMESMDRSVANIFDKLELPLPNNVPHDRNSEDPSEAKRQGLSYGKRFPITSEIEDELYRLTRVDNILHHKILQSVWPTSSLRTPLEFFSGKPATSNLTSGWHPPDKGGTWIKGRSGRIDLRADLAAKFTKIGFVMTAFIPNDTLTLNCTITRSDGRSVSQSFSKEIQFATIPMIVNSELLDGKLNTLTFKIETDNAFSPSDFGLKDQRQLSVKLHKIIPL